MLLGSALKHFNTISSIQFKQIVINFFCCKMHPRLESRVKKYIYIELGSKQTIMGLNLEN